MTSYLCITCWLKVPTSKSNCKTSADQDFGTFSSQPSGIELSSDDHSSPPAVSQVNSCAVSRRTSIGPHLRSAADDGGHISMSESHENSIVRAKLHCGAEILNFEHLKMQLDKLTGQNREKQRQSDAENGNSNISPSLSCASLSSQAATANLPYVSSWPSGLNRTPSIESDVLLPADSGISSLRSASSVATDILALLHKCTGVEQKLLLLDQACAASLASVQGDSLASGVGGQHVRHESSVSNLHHHQIHHLQHVTACCDPLTQPAVVSTWPPAACTQLMNASNTLSAFQQPGFSHEFVQPSPAYSTEWQAQQVLLQQIQQQSLMMQAQHPVITQYQQMLRLQQQLQQQQQAVQFMQSTLLQSQQCKPDMIQNAFVGRVPSATELPLQYVQWQTQLTNLLIESGLLPGKAHEVVQQLQHIMMPTSSGPLHVPGNPMTQLLTNSGCSVDPFSQLYNHLLQSPFSTGGLPWSLLMSWSNVQVAYAQVVQLLAHPNPLITPEILESMFAQLPPPLNLNASDSVNPGVMVESLHSRFLESLLVQIGQLPVTPTPPVSMHGFFGNSTSSNEDKSSVCLNKSVGMATVQSMIPGVEDKPDPGMMDSKQLCMPMKNTRTCYTGVDGSNTVVVTQTGPLNRGPSVDLESGDVPGARVSVVPRTGMSCSRHHNVTAGNGAKMSGSSVPKKTVDCPQGLADLDMALKEKLRPRTTKGTGQTVSELTKTSAAVVVSSNVVSSVLSAPSQSAAVPVTCDIERLSVTHVNASNGNLVVTPRKAPLVTDDAAAALKLHTVSVTKCAAAVISEKTDAVKKQQVSIVRDTVSKDGDVAAADTAALYCLRTTSAVPENMPLPEVTKDIVKPANSSICVSIAASSVQSMVAAKSLSQCRECASDHCLPSTAVSLPLLTLVNLDISRQHVSDSAIAATTTQLAQKHLQKKMAVTDQENISTIDVTTQQSYPMIAVSCALYNPDFFYFLSCSLAVFIDSDVLMHVISK